MSDAERASRHSTPNPQRTQRLLRGAAVPLLALLSVSGGTALSSALSATPAGADQISDLQAQAGQLQQAIDSTNAQLDASSEQYDAAQYHLSQLNGQISATKQKIAQDQAVVAHDNKVLRSASVNAFVTDGAAATANPLFSNNQKALGAQQVYNQVAEGDLDTAVANLHTAQHALDAQKAQLDSEQQQVSQQAAQAQQAKQEEAQLEAQQQGELNQDTGQIAVLVAQRQAAEEAAAAAAAREKLAAAQQAAASQQSQAQGAAPGQSQGQSGATSTSGSPGTTGTQATTPLPDGPNASQVTVQGPGGNGTAGTSSTTAPPETTSGDSGGGGGGGGSGFVAPPGASGASVAVQAALSQVGVPYVYAAASPGVGFDCSGLTMWAWEQAGVSLPHYSGAQMADTTPVPTSDLEPGDLLFYGPGGADHVAMYIGGGEMVEATHPGGTVSVTGLNLSDDGGAFAGAGRP